ncbi:MAG: hypothetical protein AAFQ73_11100 [Pseudomonadota bacterium]
MSDATGRRSTGRSEEYGFKVLGQWGLDPMDMWGQAMRGAPLGRAPKTPLEFWMSFFPAAPVFGVRWMMWDVLQGGAADRDPKKPSVAGAREGREKKALEMDAVRLEPKPAAMRSKVVAKAVEPQTESKGGAEIVSVDVAAIKASAAPLVDVDAASEAAVLETVKGPRAVVEQASRPNAAVGKVNSRSADGETRPRLRIVGQDEAEEPATQKPKGLFKKKPAKTNDLKLIKGVGPSLERLLNDLGIYQFAQIAKFSEQELLWVDAHLPSFKGRVLRDDWKAQATELIAAKKG